jgi:Right handed beta helix region
MTGRPYREKEDTRQFFATRLPGGVLVPSPVAHILSVKARHQHRLRAARNVLRVSVALGMLVLLFVHVQPAMGLGPPPVPSSEEICGSSVLNGPSSAPGGSVTVPAGDNSAEFQNPLPANTTYWFAAGTHTFATGAYGVYQTIAPGSGDVFTGAPGAILDGGGYNHYAFEATGTANNVTVEYLTIQDYNAPGGDGTVETAQAENWDVQYDTIQDNVPGAGIYLGTDDTVQHSCLTRNGEYGFAAYSVYNESPITGGPSGSVVSGNEISYNDTCNWEHDASFPITPPSGCGSVGFVGCGCSGAGKFWEALNSTFDDNYVHNDYAAGAWWDTDNAGAQAVGNYIADEYAVGIIYEISYNFLMENNVFVDDAWGVGPLNPGFPSSAIYINSSGSDPRVSSNYSAASDITGNQFYDNWGGVVLYETADRFCASPANTSTGICTLVNPDVATIQTCSNVPQPVPPSRTVGSPAPAGRRTGPPARGGTSQGQSFGVYIDRLPYYSDCRWKTQNVAVSGNTFSFSAADIGPSCTLANWCGFSGLFSNYGVTPPYLAYTTANAITYTQNDLFSGNTYCGTWSFDPYIQGSQDSFATWQGAPYAQDPGSTLDGPACYPSSAGPVGGSVPGPVNRTITIPIRAGGGSR